MIPFNYLYANTDVNTEVFSIAAAVYGSESESDNDDLDIPRLTSQLETEHLCIKNCLSSKNVISGQGLITGTDSLDYIVGSTFDDIAFVKDGSDLTFLDLGVDRFYGGNGDDTVMGGPGNDQLLGENGDDILFGGFDDDLIVAGPGNDHMFGDFGNDILVTGPGADYVSCEDGMDVVIGFDPSQGDVTAGDCEIFQPLVLQVSQK
jgi:Ca2+-binding RTX toxin-like protein